MFKRMWHKFFGHPNVSNFTCPTCGKLRRQGELSNVQRPVKSDDHMAEYHKSNTRLLL